MEQGREGGMKAEALGLVTRKKSREWVWTTSPSSGTQDSTPYLAKVPERSDCSL